MSVPMKVAIFMIILYELCYDIYILYVEIILVSDLPQRLEKKSPRYIDDGEWIFYLRLIYMIGMYGLDIYVFFKHFGGYLAARGDGMRDSPADRKPLLKGMNLILIKTITVPIVLTISNIIIGDLEKNKVVYDTIKWPV